MTKHVDAFTATQRRRRLPGYAPLTLWSDGDRTVHHDRFRKAFLKNKVEPVCMTAVHTTYPLAVIHQWLVGQEFPQLGRTW